MDRDPKVLDKASAGADPDAWAASAFTVGLLGFPICFIATALTHSLVPDALGAAAALTYIHMGQRKWKGRLLGQTGVILTFLWAPLVLIWSVLFLIHPV